MPERLQIGVGAGLLAPPLFLAVIVGLTVRQASFLDASRWSAIHRSKVQWPSLLALGPSGWLMVTTFVLCGAMAVAFGGALAVAVPTLMARVGAVLICAIGVALCFVAFKADPPEWAGEPSWHDQIHNAAYPIIPLFGILSALLLSAGLWRESEWVTASRISACAAGAIASGLVLTGVDSIAQLARYFLFGFLLLWIEFLALTCRRVQRRARQGTGAATSGGSSGG
jgi:Protein of unknown function (DUF998)